MGKNGIMKNVQVGDKVRFLNASGGGVIRRIKKNIAWVEGEDGFELPTPISECVVVDGNDTFVSGYKTPAEKRAEQAQKETKVASQSPKTITASKEETPIQIPVIDRPGGDAVDFSVAYLPVDYKSFGSSAYEMYLINESNYYLTFTYATRTRSGRYHFRAQGIVEPDTRVFVEEFAPDQLNEMEYSLVQLLPYKMQRGYQSLQPFSVEWHLEGVKFFKRHCFRENPFFDEDALVYPLIVKGKSHSVAPTNAGEPEAVLQEKVQRDRSPQKVQSTQPQPQLDCKDGVVDLHISALLDDSVGMTPHEILLYQVKSFERELEKRPKGSKVIFIHGKGQGVLRQTLIQTIERKYPKVSHRDASFKEYGFGAIEVIIH